MRKHRAIKAWFSGHFHLGQDYQDSITFPTIPREQGPYPNRGSCVFAQTSVMRKGTSRDTRQQSRLLRGNKDGFQICTVNHAKGGEVRLDATISYTDENHEVGVYAHEHDDLAHDNFVKVYSPSENDECNHICNHICNHNCNHNFVKVYSPSENDECYVGPEQDDSLAINPCGKAGPGTVAWWKMSCGRVLGIYDGRLVECSPPATFNYDGR